MGVKRGGKKHVRGRRPLSGVKGKKIKQPPRNFKAGDGAVQAKVVAAAVGGAAPMEVVGGGAGSGPRKLAEAVLEKALRRRAERAAKKARKEQAKAAAAAAPAAAPDAKAPPAKGLHTVLLPRGKILVKNGRLQTFGRHKAPAAKKQAKTAKPGQEARKQAIARARAAAASATQPAGAAPPAGGAAATPVPSAPQQPAAAAAEASARDSLTRQQKRKDANRAIKVQKTAWKKQHQSRR